MINDIKYFYVLEEDLQSFFEELKDIVSYYSLEDCNIDENYV